jgi:hypothetical protein
MSAVKSSREKHSRVSHTRFSKPTVMHWLRFHQPIGYVAAILPDAPRNMCAILTRVAL